RVRYNAAGKLEFKLAPTTVAYTNFSYSNWKEAYYEPSTFRRFVVATATNASTVAPGDTDDTRTWSRTSATFARLGIGAAHKLVQSRQAGTGIKHQLGDWTLDLNAAYSWANTRYDSLPEGVGVAMARITGVGITVDRRNRSRYYPAIIQNSGPDIYNLANYSF